MESMSIKETLREAREAVIEIESLRESVRVINNRLYAAPGVKLNRERGCVDRFAMEKKIDRKCKLEQSLEAAVERAKEIIDRAERCIELVKNPRKRAAMRYYYLCAASSYEAVAELCGCSISSVKRWLT